ncbi:hypothetical protein ACNKHP_09000 [Shigella boydii]
MAKLYLPAIKDGADNSLVVDGPAVPHPACGIPQGAKPVAIPAAGGRGEPRPLTESDWKIALLDWA